MFQVNAPRRAKATCIEGITVYKNNTAFVDTFYMIANQLV